MSAAPEIHHYPLATLEMDKARNILFFRVKQDIEVDVPEIREMIRYAKEVAGERRHYAVIDFGASLGSTAEARAIYAADPFLQQYRIADAFLVKSLSVRLVANFFIKVTKPQVNTRLFSDEKAAVDWLLQQGGRVIKKPRCWPGSNAVDQHLFLFGVA